MKDYYNDKQVKFQHSPVTNKYANALNAVGATDSLTLRTLPITPSNSNVVAISSTGSDDTGSGTLESPYATINHAKDQCDASKQYVYILDSETYEEEGFELTGNFKGVLAKIGETPTVKFTTNNTFVESLITVDARVNNADNLRASVLLSDTELLYLKVVYNVPDGVFIQRKSVNVESGAEIKTAVNITDGYAVDAYMDIELIDSTKLLVVYERRSADTLTYYLHYKVINISDGSDYIAQQTIASQSSAYYNIGCCMINDTDFVMTFKDGTDNKTKYYIIYYVSGSVEKSITTILNFNNLPLLPVFYDDLYVVLAYVDSTDSDKTKYIVFDPSDASIIVSAKTVLTHSVYITKPYILSNNDMVFIHNSTSPSVGTYYSIIDVPTGDYVFPKTIFDSAVGPYTHIDIKTDGSLVCTFGNYHKGIIQLGYYCKISTDAIFNGVIFDSGNYPYFYIMFKLNSAEVEFKWCTIKDFESQITYTPFYIISGNDTANLYNTIITDCGGGIDITANAAVLQDSQFIRIDDDYAIHIDGAASASGDITIEHCDIFNCYAGIRLENNNGANEIILNNIIHSISNYGIYADTEVTESYGVNTATNQNVTRGSSVFLSNPLYVNEGAADPDDTDLNIKVRITGYYSDSPAKDLADDDRNAGSFNVEYIGSETTWSDFTIDKPKVFGPPRLVPVGSADNIGKDGTPASKKDAQFEELSMVFSSFSPADLENLLDMWCNNDEATVRLYPDPTTNESDYDTWEIIRSEPIPLGPEFWKFQDLGGQEFPLTLRRKYETS